MESLREIMVVDDDQDMQEMVLFALEGMEEVKVQVCGSGEEAIESCKKSMPQLILLDAEMPTMNGMATLQEIRKLPQGESASIIFITASGAPHEISAYKKIGAVHVIVKPIDPLKLAGQLEGIWKVRNYIKS